MGLCVLNAQRSEVEGCGGFDPVVARHKRVGDICHLDVHRFDRGLGVDVHNGQENRAGSIHSNRQRHDALTVYGNRR